MKYNDEEYKIDKRVAVEVYKWLKIAQSLILVALGAIFLVCSIGAIKSNSDQNFSSSLPICIGVVLTIFGVLDLMAGYFLHRNLMSEEVLLGAVSVAISVVFFVKSKDSSQFLSDVLNIFIVSLLFIYAVMCVVYGIDRALGKKGITKNVTLAVLSFIGAALLLAGGIAYIILEKKYSGKISQYIFLVVGFVLILIGIISFVSLIIKIRETKKALQLEEVEKQKQQEEKEEDMNSEVKVVELTDLKKERKRDKKVFNRKTVGETQTMEFDENGKLIENSPKKIENNSHKK